MRIKGFASSVVVSLALAACGQGDSDNVMAPQANALSPAQVDLALGPEVANAAANETETTNEVENAVPAEPEDRPAPVLTNNGADEVPEDDESETPPTDANTSAEEMR